MQIFDEVKKIEQEATDLELDYQNKLHKLEQNTQDKIGEMKRNIEKELANFQADELAKKSEQLTILKQRSAESEKTEIEKLKTRFAAKEEELVNAVIEEVMRKYGNR
ncbi:hypothetical protein [Trichococcus ilyis]|jgi:hypothetical protein|uniref:Uncharacterized protein n=1 Tax=Trichococcus ilyis TaxID=640938 RepID=A0A143Z2N1_9LACT|nr:hypothetical protein [Trichococcus ilyis]CZR05348.1 Hypothetical protein TR210_2207 [Trichococcus ilyis]SEJ50181.1 hypothetical protein SAMN05216375_11563 [Trichococcus ilyis]